MMSVHRVWAVMILLAGLMGIPYAWGSIPARLQAAAAARKPVPARHSHLSDRPSVSDTQSSRRAPASVPVRDSIASEAPTLDTAESNVLVLESPRLDPPVLESMPVENLSLEEPAQNAPDEGPRLEPAGEDRAPSLEPIPLASPAADSAQLRSVPRTQGHVLRDDRDDLDFAAGAPQRLIPDSDEMPIENQPVDVPTDEAVSPSGEPATESSSTLAPQADVPPPPAATAPKPTKTFSPEMTRLRNRIRTCLSHYYQHATSIDERSPWGVMHSLIAFGVDTELVAGNRRVNAIGWLCYNRPCKGMTLMTVKNGQLMMRSNGPGYQGHDGQLLSMLALSGVKSDYPIRAEGHEFTVADLVTFEQLNCKPKSELTFQLIGLAHYLPSDATWKDKTGGAWSIPRLIREEIAQPVNGAACGGTHRLIGLSMAVKTRQKRSEPIDGEWLRAQKLVTSYQQHAFKLQNRDGSFSTSWLAKRDDSGDIDRRIQTSGHILEWLIFSLPEKDLTDPRMIKGVSYLTNVLMNNDRDWEIGPRGHALRALALYNERVFGDKPGERRELLARRPGK